MKTISILLLSVLSVVAQTAPSWRGNPQTTFQEWTFPTDSKTPDPVAGNNTYGVQCKIQTGAMATGWWQKMPVLGLNNIGAWDLGSNGYAMFTCFGPVVSNQTWTAIVQAIYYWDSWTFQALPIVDVQGATLVSSNRTTLSVNALGGQWQLLTATFKATNHCARTWIYAPWSGLLLDYVSIDTIAEPPQAMPSLPPLELYFDGGDSRRYAILSSTNMWDWTTNFVFQGLIRKPFQFFMSQDIPRAYRVVVVP